MAPIPFWLVLALMAGFGLLTFLLGHFLEYWAAAIRAHKVAVEVDAEVHHLLVQIDQLSQEARDSWRLAQEYAEENHTLRAIGAHGHGAGHGITSREV